MSRTPLGNLTGQAAQIERRDFREYLDEVSDHSSAYWKSKADAALCRLQDVVGIGEGRRQTENITGSWKTIAYLIGLLADLAEKQVVDEAKADYRERAELYEIGMGR